MQQQGGQDPGRTNVHARGRRWSIVAAFAAILSGAYSGYNHARWQAIESEPTKAKTARSLSEAEVRPRGMQKIDQPDAVASAENQRREEAVQRPPIEIKEAQPAKDATDVRRHKLDDERQEKDGTGAIEKRTEALAERRTAAVEEARAKNAGRRKDDDTRRGTEAKDIGGSPSEELPVPKKAGGDVQPRPADRHAQADGKDRPAAVEKRQAEGVAEVKDAGPRNHDNTRPETEAKGTGGIGKEELQLGTPRGANRETRRGEGQGFDIPPEMSKSDRRVELGARVLAVLKRTRCYDGTVAYDANEAQDGLNRLFTKAEAARTVAPPPIMLAMASAADLEAWLRAAEALDDGLCMRATQLASPSRPSAAISRRQRQERAASRRQYSLPRPATQYTSRPAEAELMLGVGY